MSWESEGISFLAALIVASLVRPLGLVVAAWLILRILRVRHPASRHAVWTAVLIGMTLLPFVSVIAPHWKAPVLARKHDAVLRTLAIEPALTGSALPAGEMERRQAGDRPGGLSYKPSSGTLAIWCYLAGLFAMATYRMAGWVLLWRVVSRSKRLRAYCLRESADVLTPVAVGVLRPAVLLPAGWRTWNATTRRAVLAHEFAHLRRRDTLVSALARLVTCAFWFHPLAWWVSRKISDLAELACDAVVLERVDDPAGYSRILLEFAGAVNRAGRRVALPGLAMAASSGMGRRIDQVFELSGGLSSGKLRKLSRPGALLALMGVPVMCLAATVGLGESGSDSPRPPRPPRPPAAPLVVSMPDTPPIQVQSPPAFEAPPVKRPVAPPVAAQQSMKLEDAPVSLGLIIDNSGSMREKRKKVEAAALDLVLASNKDDETFVVNFNDSAYLDLPHQKDFTSDIEEVKEALTRSDARGGTAMRDAVNMSILHLKAKARRDKKVLVVFTDGVDNSSSISLDGLVKTARQSGVLIYAVGLLGDEDQHDATRAKRELDSLAEATGGQAFYPRELADVERIAQEVAHNIRNR